MSRIDTFKAMLERGQDGALLRFSLGNEYLAAGEPGEAAAHLRRAVEHDRDYSAAWKTLGTALQRADDAAGARAAWREGIEAAERRGDKQAAKEMQAFLRKLDKAGR